MQRRVEHFLQRTGMAPARFGRNAVRDPRLVFDLRRGRQLRPATERRIRTYLEEQERLLQAAAAESRPPAGARAG